MNNLFDLLDDGESGQDSDAADSTIDSQSPKYKKCIECLQDINLLLFSRRYPDVCIMCVGVCPKYDYK